jgi:hypothetical protein
MKIFVPSGSPGPGLSKYFRKKTWQRNWQTNWKKIGKIWPKLSKMISFIKHKEYGENII